MVIKNTPPRHRRGGPSCLVMTMLIIFVGFGVWVSSFVIQNPAEVRNVIFPTATPEPTRSATEYALLAQLSQEEGELAEALGYYAGAVSLDATKPEIYIRYITLLVETGDAEEALARGEEAIVLAPDNDRVWTAVAAAYIANGDRLLDAGDPQGANLEYAKAIDAAERAVSLDGQNATAYAYIAAGLVLQGDPNFFQDAQIQAETAVTLDPNNPIARYYMAEVLTLQGFYQAAREQYQLGLQANENYAPLYIGLAYNFFASPDASSAQAILAFKNAIEIDSGNAAAYDGLAYMYLQVGDDTEAEKNAIISVELDPDVARAHGRLGEAYMRNNKFDLAIQEFSRAVELYGEPTEINARFFYLLADAYIRAGLGNCPQAEPLLRAVSEKNQYYAELAQVYLLDCRRAGLGADP